MTYRVELTARAISVIEYIPMSPCARRGTHSQRQSKSAVADFDINRGVEDKLNSRPRKILGPKPGKPDFGGAPQL
jgi:hypothetical protein